MNRYWPLGDGRIVTSQFGPRPGGYHWGVDFGRNGGSAGMPVYAAQAGTVVMAGAASGFGGPDPAGWVVIDHPSEAGGGTTVYGHIVREVAVGHAVAAGQRIGHINPSSATNGNVAPHLHFEVHRWVWSAPGPDRIDPLPWLAGALEPGVEVQPVQGLTAESLSAAMGGTLPLDRYRQLLPAVDEALVAADCTTVNRAAMWMAQVGHESAGLRYMREIADGSAYEGRIDLGNTQIGDGVRFAGRGPIQITGRHNYTRLSEWAHSRGYVPSPRFFVDNPAQLESDRYGFLGVTWYWTVARPQINAMCDAGDLLGVTRAINGGLNGIEDRRARWYRCRSLGTAILPIGDDMPSADEVAAAVWAHRVRKPGARDGLNEDGIDNETAGNMLAWTDLHAGAAVDQVSGLGSKDRRDGGATGHEQLGGRSVVDALAAIGEHLGLPGFKAPGGAK